MIGRAHIPLFFFCARRLGWLSVGFPDPLHPDLFLFVQIFCIASKEASPSPPGR
ncbi:hypothetical protein Zm00014a_032165 [Zea mays]|uniref:Uncharacterized protein n=1 Tax=Zea mays TaxID=4577 RepID=A0A317YCK0_MAIZE|nr:hypothetical protein Zm00014a_032165 [Zea mays]